MTSRRTSRSNARRPCCGLNPPGAGRLQLPADALALLLRLAEPRPRPPGDGLAREPERPPVGGELVEEGVGRRVVRLSGVAHHPGDAGEQDEEVEVAVHRRPVQVPGAEHLRPEHRLEALPGLVAERGVGEHPDAVDDAAERRQSAIHAFEHRVERGGVGHVRELRLDRGPARAQRGDHLLGLRVRSAPAVQHDGPRTTVREPFGHHAADPAETAGHQVRPVGAQPAGFERRCGQHDLADVAGRAHEVHRLPGLGQRPPAVDDRLDLTRFEPLHHAAQGVAGLGREVLLEHVELQDVVRDIRPGRRHLLLAPDVDPRQLHEPAAVGEARQARLDEALAGQAVQHHVDPGPAGGFQDLPAERGGAAVEHVLHAERAQIRPLARARGREDLRAGRVRPLDGGEPDASGAGVNEHSLTGREAREVVRQHRGDERGRHRRERGDGEARRRGRHHRLAGHRLRPEGAERESRHEIAHRDGGHVRTRLQDPAAELPAEQPLVDEADRAEHVPEVEARRLDRHAHVSRPDGAYRQRSHPHVLERPARVGLQQPAGVVGRREPVGAVPVPDQAGGLAASEAVRNVGLRIGVHQLVDEVGERCVLSRLSRPPRLQVDHPRLEVDRLPGHDLADAPQGRAGELPAALLLHHLTAAGDEPHALRGHCVGVGDALHEGERAPRRALRVRRHLLGRRPRAVTVQGRKVDDAGERYVFGEIFQDGLPRLAVLHPHCVNAGCVGPTGPGSGEELGAGGSCPRRRERDALASGRTFSHPALTAADVGVPGCAGLRPACGRDARAPRVATNPVYTHLHRHAGDSGLARGRILARQRLSTRQHHGLVPRRQRLGQRRGDAAAVRGQHPHPGRFDDLHRSLRHDDAPVRVRVRVGLVDSEHRDVPEVRIPQRLPPNRGARQRVVRAVVVGEPPPAVELPERQVQPALPAEVLRAPPTAPTARAAPGSGRASPPGTGWRAARWRR